MKALKLPTYYYFHNHFQIRMNKLHDFYVQPISLYSSKGTFLCYVITKTRLQDVTPLTLYPINKEIVIYLFLYIPHLVLTFLDPLCKVKFGFFYTFYYIPSLTKFLLCFNGWMFLCIFTEKKLPLPDLRPVVVQKSSTTGNFRKTHSNFSFWNTVVPRGWEHLPAQYFKSEMEWCSVLNRRGNGLLQNKALNNTKCHAGWTSCVLLGARGYRLTLK